MAEEGTKEKEKSPIGWFVGLCICTVLLLVLGMGWNHYAMNKNQERIIAKYDSCIVQINTDTVHLRNASEQYIEKVKANEEAIKGILEQGYSKIQSEYESVEIWIGIVTVVFLIFSFYSLFKTETLERQSRDAAHRIQEEADEWEKKEKEYSGQVGKLKKDMNKSLSDVKLKKESLEKEFSDNIDKMSKTLSDKLGDIIIDKFKEYDKNIEKREKELQALRKKVDENLESFEPMSSEDIDNIFNGTFHEDGKEEK